MLEAQFLQGSLGSIFAIYYPPVIAAVQRGRLLYIHPFAEELNKSRRMVALQAQQFAANGFSVLVPDLYGCGDSGGDFADARWDVWLDDLHRCLDWLRARGEGPCYLWGLRAGALLAAEMVQTTAVAGLILWHPVMNGAQMLTQFLRLRLAVGMMRGSQETIAQLREALAAGKSLEVAGYELSPALAAALEQARLQAPPPADVRVDWFDVVTEAGRPLLPASCRLVEQWQVAGVTVHARAVVGEHFWATQYLTPAPELLQATTASLCRSGNIPDHDHTQVVPLL